MKRYHILLIIIVCLVAASLCSEMAAAPKKSKRWRKVEKAIEAKDTPAIEKAIMEYLLRDSKDDSLVLEAHNFLTNYYINSRNIPGIYQEYRYYQHRAASGDAMAESAMTRLGQLYQDALTRQLQDGNLSEMEGIWMSDLFDEKDFVPYLAIKIEIDSTGLVGGILPGCGFAKEMKIFRDGNGDGLSWGSTLVSMDDGSMRLARGRNRLSRCYPLLTQIVINGIADIQAVVESAYKNYQAEYLEKKNTQDWDAFVQSKVALATMNIWTQAIMETGMNKTKVGDSWTLEIWKQQDTPNQLRVKISYLMQLLEAGLPKDSEPDVELWRKYFRLYKVQPHDEVMFKHDDLPILANAIGIGGNIFQFLGTDSLTLNDSSTLNKIYAQRVISSKDYRKQLEYYYPDLLNKENKWTNEEMLKKFAINVIFVPMRDDPVGQPLQQMPNISLKYFPRQRQSYMQLYGGNGNGDSIVATIRYNGDIYFEQLKYGHPTGVYSQYYSDGTYVYSRELTDTGLSRGEISNAALRHHYEGEFKKISKEGQGTATYPDGSQYTGQWKRNRRDGQGSLVAATGEFWAGTFVANKPYNGEGTLVLRDKTVITGRMTNGTFTGEVSVTFPDGTTYKGDATGCDALNDIKL